MNPDTFFTELPEGKDNILEYLKSRHPKMPNYSNVYWAIAWAMENIYEVQNAMKVVTKSYLEEQGVKL